MLRSKLTFDQLVGFNIQYGEDQSPVQTIPGCSGWASALCSNHEMRSGRHFAVFMCSGRTKIGVTRPVKINRSDFDDIDLIHFSPGMPMFREYLRGKRTGRWRDSDVHCCYVFTGGISNWFDWESDPPLARTIDGFQHDAPIGLLLDLDEGQRLALLKDGLSGEYCWYATVGPGDTISSIERGSAPGERG